jgi:hypothetical protein
MLFTNETGPRCTPLVHCSATVDLDPVALAADERIGGACSGSRADVEVLDERHDAAVVPEGLLLARSLVHDADRDAGVEEGELAQPLASTSQPRTRRSP